MTDELRKNAVCGTCTLKLVVIAYRRAPWFRLLREPLKLGMRCLSLIHHVDTAEYLVRTPACFNCIRFYKVALKEKSATFRWLHTWINPVFDYFLEKIVTGEELRQAKTYARAASQGGLGQEQTDDWMRNMRTGF
ncbi:MAG: nitroreductase [Dehalococcoidia bacterium]|nr:nitroreductase [Dehalococcoidia bacterium]